MSPSLWNLEAVIAATGGEACGACSSAFAGISIDSRTLKSGELFVAISGERFDGHDFVGQALQNGAGAALVGRSQAQKRGFSERVILVDEPLRALENLACAARGRFEGQVFAITGSVGKTSSKEMLRRVLSHYGAVHYSPASFNNHWGVPLTLSRLPAQHSFGVFEIGMNHAGEIAPLVGLVRPHVALITTVEPVHIEHFFDITGIADAKAEIFEGIATGGIAVLPFDNPCFARLRAHVLASGVGRVLTFGANAGADVQLMDVRSLDQGMRIFARLFDRSLDFFLPLQGRHQALNALALVAGLHGAGFDISSALPYFEDVKSLGGRGEQFVFYLPEGGSFTLIDESYNANPASMKAALQVLSDMPIAAGARKIAVLGDMLELGEHGPVYHEELGHFLNDIAVDQVYACGTLMPFLFSVLSDPKRAVLAYTIDGLLDALMGSVRAGDVVMIKGSNGSRMWSLVDAFKRYFSVKGSEAHAAILS